MPRMMRAMAARPPTTPPTIGPTGVEEPLSGEGVGVLDWDRELELEGEELELELEVELELELVDEGLDELALVGTGVYQTLSVPAATPQPSKV
jgi:hypothetical protein